jgi:hypothetical protein
MLGSFRLKSKQRPPDKRDTNAVEDIDELAAPAGPVDPGGAAAAAVAAAPGATGPGALATCSMGFATRFSVISSRRFQRTV